ncbi:sister chromatid cohesion protein PDS5 homolog D isoform X2 [Solanum dulcamara]|uniref:sister chromatid cohesion protein PDS5 homolog D isoform X2 n=1 Tax=Solanum dulcamara TaxID=45834 RepID=UPI0024866305|nr:sister chromatid cohesion protein PDS5 homolog D isoform X2 [Solanum dulcamara]
MAGYCSCCVSLEKVEEDLTAYGMNLMNPPSATDELFKLLEKVESLLKMVSQHPFDSTRSALQPVMKALVSNELLRHTNEDVKVSVVSCITEISRIFAPKYPYDDHKQLEEILQQTVMALKKLSDVSGRSYRKVVRILEIFAKVRVCVVLLDLENETLVIEIFRLFLEVIRPYHPRNIFTWMKEIMTRLIEGSEELSVELLQPLLDSVKIDNQMASPVASKLGEKALKDSAAIVKPYFAEALKSMSLDSDYYAEIGTLLCNELPKGKEMMTIENAPDTVHHVKVGPSVAKICEPALQDDTHREKLKDTGTTNIMKPDNPEDVQNQEGTGSLGHWFQPKKNEILINEDSELVVLLPIEDVPQSQVQEKNSLHLGLTWGGERTKRTLCAKRKPGRDSRKNESASNCDAERKSESSIKMEVGNLKEHKEPSLQQIYGMKQKKKKKKTTTKIHGIEESGDKATKLSVKDENHLNKCANCKSGRKLATRKHEDSKRARTSKDHGAELIGAKIKVWWPLEQAFYEGVVSSFNPMKRKHKVVYDDGQVEKLRLHREQWEMLEDNSSQKDHELDFQGHAVSSATGVGLQRRKQRETSQRGRTSLHPKGLKVLRSKGH